MEAVGNEWKKLENKNDYSSRYRVAPGLNKTVVDLLFKPQLIVSISNASFLSLQSYSRRSRAVRFSICCASISFNVRCKTSRISDINATSLINSSSG